MNNDEMIFPHIENLEDFRKLQLALQTRKKKALSDSGHKIYKASLPNPIGKRIEFLREHLHMSQVGLATRAGVSRSTVIRCESFGAIPNLEHLERMVNALSCTHKNFIADPYNYEAWTTRFGDVEELPIEQVTFRELNDIKSEIHAQFTGARIRHTEDGMVYYLSQQEIEALLVQLDATIDLTAQLMLNFKRPRHNRTETTKKSKE